MYTTLRRLLGTGLRLLDVNIQSWGLRSGDSARRARAHCTDAELATGSRGRDARDARVWTTPSAMRAATVPALSMGGDLPHSLYVPFPLPAKRRAACSPRPVLTPRAGPCASPTRLPTVPR